MKMYFLMVIMTMSISLFAQPANNTNIIKTNDSDKTEIINAIKAETKSFYQGDYNGWRSQWSQDENSLVAWNNADGTYKHMRGWNAINDEFEGRIKRSKEVAHPDFNVGQLHIEVSGNIALVVYNEYVANKKMMFSKVPGSKTLKKINGQWKLHSVVSFWDYNYQYTKDQVKEFVEGSGF